MNIASWLVDTITVASASSVDANGDPSFGSSATMSARVERGSRLIKKADGSELQCEAVVVVLSQIKTTDRVWLPEDDATDTAAGRQPIAIQYATNKDGSSGFWQVYL